jgi:hypothetical protein
MLLKVSTGKAASKHEFDDECTFLALVQAVAEITKIPDTEIEILAGFPPKQIQPSNVNELVRNLGIVSGTMVTVRQNAERRSIVATLTEIGFASHLILSVIHSMKSNSLEEAIELCEQLGDPGAAPTASATRKMSVWPIPADNSCLFNAIDFLLYGDEGAKLQGPMYYRRLVVGAIREDPVMYNEEFLEKKPDAYITWILNPEKWGGEIELFILSAQLRVEIAVVDVETNVSLVYGSGAGYDHRIFLIYDGTHYDAVVNDLLPPSSNARLFPPGSDDILEEVKALARTKREMRQFTNLRSGSLMCKQCNGVFVGQAEAVQHAQRTGHTNFGEVV